jgi:hypothetical protein
MNESELFQPIKNYFADSGYTVDGEVKDCDMVMKKENDFIVVELKNDLNFKIFMQGAKRQKMFQHVFIAVWTPKNLKSKAFRDKVYLLNRLGLGLILVSKRAKMVTIFAQPMVHPLSNYNTRNKKTKDRVISELNGRRTKQNIGGVNKKTVLTAYKEDCLLILDLMKQQGSLKASIIKDQTGIKTSYNKIYQNHYGWFVKEGKGIYGLSDFGQKAFVENITTIEMIKSNDHIKNDNESNENWKGLL